MTTKDVATLLGLGEGTVINYRVYSKPGGRYADHPFPEPDDGVSGRPLWKSERAAEIREWAASRPGKGVGGGRPPKTELAAYAFRDAQTTEIHGPWDALTDGDFATGMLLFNPARPSPFAGHTLEVRYGPWHEEVTARGLSLAKVGEDGGVLVRETPELHELLFPAAGADAPQ